MTVSWKDNGDQVKEIKQIQGDHDDNGKEKKLINQWLVDCCLQWSVCITFENWIKGFTTQKIY